jgi:hypothetical protein
MTCSELPNFQGNMQRVQKEVTSLKIHNLQKWHNTTSHIAALENQFTNFGQEWIINFCSSLSQIWQEAICF